MGVYFVNALFFYRGRLNNCKTAMELAKREFDIPLVLRPEDLSSPDLDELSGMTYLSYFMKVDSPGYRATLNMIRRLLKKGTVNNFTVRNEQKLNGAILPSSFYFHIDRNALSRDTCYEVVSFYFFVQLVANKILPLLT